MTQHWSIGTSLLLGLDGGVLEVALWLGGGSPGVLSQPLGLPWARDLLYLFPHAFCYALQGVVEFSLCLLFAKLVSYTFLYWLPLYIFNVGK